MTDPVKPRRKVTAQIPISLNPSPSPASSSTSVSRPRARVDPSSFATPPSSSRPSLRSTPSSTSLRSATSSTFSRARSPAPPIGDVPPVPRARLTPGVGASASSPAVPTTSTPRRAPSDEHTPTRALPRVKSTVFKTPGSATPTGGTPANGKRIGGGSVGEAGPGPATVAARVRLDARSMEPVKPSITAQSSTSTPTGRALRARTLSNVSGTATTGTTASATAHALAPPSPQPSPLLSPTSMESTRPRITRSPDIYGDASDIGGASNRSSPSRPSLPLPSAQIAQLALVFSQHPAASAPSSPHHPTTAIYEPPLSAGRAAHRRAPLPYNPYTHHPPSLPPPPLSPELRTVALPLLTPGRSSDEYSRPSSEARRISISGSEVSEVVSALLEHVSASSGRPERDRLSGSTAVDEDSNEEKGKDQIADVEVVLDGEADDVEEAKVNRKVADLEISNASLLAINRTLEATKAKQRSEILKLRRALRESLHGITPSLALAPTSTSTSSLHSALSFLSPAAEPYADDLDGYFSDEAMTDPQLEARWDKVTDTLGHMLRRGEEAVARGRENVKPEGAKVLGWMDMDGVEDGSGSAAGTGTGAVGTPDRGGTASPVA